MKSCYHAHSFIVHTPTNVCDLRAVGPPSRFTSPSPVAHTRRLPPCCILGRVGSRTCRRRRHARRSTRSSSHCPTDRCPSFIIINRRRLARHAAPAVRSPHHPAKFCARGRRCHCDRHAFHIERWWRCPPESFLRVTTYDTPATIITDRTA